MKHTDDYFKSYIPFCLNDPTVYAIILYYFVTNYHNLLVKNNTHLLSQSPA